MWNEYVNQYVNIILFPFRMQSSFMSLTLSTDGASLDCTSEGRTFRSNLALTVSSSSASSCDSSTLPSTLSTPALRKKRALRINSSAATSNVSWETPESSKERPNIALSSASTDDVSMPDVDEALRRLGLPSMQSVLRRWMNELSFPNSFVR